MSLLDQWKVAQSTLADATNNFHSLSIALQADINQPGTKSNDTDPAQPVLAELGQLLPEIESSRRCLHSASLLVKRMRNASTILIPINRLPTETLSEILAISVQSSPCSILLDPEEDTMCSKLQLVCTLWHRVVLQTPHIWSHVDVLDTYIAHNSIVLAPYAVTHLKRAYGTPITLHFSYHTGSEDYRVLAPNMVRYMNNVTSLVFHKDLRSRFVLSILNACDNGNTLHCTDKLVHSDYDPPYLASRDSAFYGLLHLQIGGIEHHYTESSEFLEGFLAVLSCNPFLRTIRFNKPPYRKEAPLNHLPQVSLPHLELLHIHHETAWEEYEADLLILSKVSPGLSKLDLRIDLPGTTDGVAVFESFMRRSNVVSLSLALLSRNRDSLKPCLSFASNAHTLVLNITSFNTKDDISHISSALLTGDIPDVQHAPKPGLDWACSARLSHLKTLVLWSNSPNHVADGKAMLQLLPVIWAYPLNLLAFAQPWGFEYSPFSRDELEWVEARVEVEHMAKDWENFDSGDPYWNDFMYRLYTS